MAYQVDRLRRVSSATPGELRELIRSGEFSEQTHLGVLALAMVKGLLAF